VTTGVELHFTVLDSNDSTTELSTDVPAVTDSEGAMEKCCGEDCGETNVVLSAVLPLRLGDCCTCARDSLKGGSLGLADFPAAGHEEMFVRFGEGLRGRGSNERKNDVALSKFLRSDCFVERVDSAEVRPVGGFWAAGEISVRFDDELQVDCDDCSSDSLNSLLLSSEELFAPFSASAIPQAL